MESSGRTESNGRLLLITFAAAGTLLLAFVPSGAWLGSLETEETLFAILLKQFLTVLLLLIVPSLCAMSVHRTSPWMLLGLAAFAFSAGFLVTRDAKEALYSLFLTVLPGAGLYALQRAKLSNFRTVIYGSFVILIAMFGFVCLRDLIRTGDAYASYRSVIRMYGALLERYAPAGSLYGVDFAAQAKEITDLFLVNAESLCATALLTPAMAAAFSNTLFSHLWNRNGAVRLSPLPPFSQWRCERWYALLSVGFYFATVILGLFGVRWGASLSGVAELLWKMPCMLGGISAIRRLGQLTGRTWILWAAVVLLILLPPATCMLLAILGMLSALRKPKNVGEDGERK